MKSSQQWSTTLENSGTEGHLRRKYVLHQPLLRTKHGNH
jgi:hypothetical protein